MNNNLFDTVVNWYNICFTLGDYSNDGHGHSEDFHMIANYPVDQIEMAYEQASCRLGFDFCQKCCIDYGEWRIKPFYASKLSAEDIIEYDSEIEPAGYELGCETTCEDEFIEIFVKIVQLVLPDFEMKERDLEEKCLGPLEGAGYGLFDL